LALAIFTDEKLGRLSRGGYDALGLIFSLPRPIGVGEAAVGEAAGFGEACDSGLSEPAQPTTNDAHTTTMSALTAR